MKISKQWLAGMALVALSPFASAAPNLIVNGGSAGIDPVNGNYTITDNTIDAPVGIWTISRRP